MNDAVQQKRASVYFPNEAFVLPEKRMRIIAQ